MPNRYDIDTIRQYAINDPVRPHQHFAQVVAAEFGQRAAAVGQLSDLPGA